jgi:hypothetical protein
MSGMLLLLTVEIKNYKLWVGPHWHSIHTQFHENQAADSKERISGYPIIWS